MTEMGAIVGFRHEGTSPLTKEFQKMEVTW